MSTPAVNTLLALPYKKRPVSSSSSFKAAWTEQKEYLRKVSGRGGLYQENKERRRSESFPWPDSPSDLATPTPTQASSSAPLLPSTTHQRSTNNNPSVSSSLSTCIGARRAPINTEEDYMLKLGDLGDKLKEANTRIAELSSKVDDLNLQKCDYEAQIRSLTRKNQDLQRLLSSYEG